MKEKIKLAIQYIVGIIFIFSGITKILDSQGFSSLINAYGFGWAANVAPVISSVEIILGLCLILNIRPATTSLFAAVITLLFTIAYSYAFFSRHIDDCGCMGSLIKISPAISFARNIFIIFSCAWIYQNFRNTDTSASNWKKWIVYILGALSLCVSGYTLGGKPLIKKDKIQIGEQINTTFFKYFDNKISKDTCIVFVFRPECYHCWNTTENVKSIRRTPGFENVLGITYANADTSEYMKEMNPNFDVMKYPNNELYNYIISVPVLLVLKDGKVIKKFRANDIPCGPILRRMLKSDN